MLGLGAVVLAVEVSLVVAVGIVAVELEVFEGSVLLAVGSVVPLGSVEPELELGPSVSGSVVSSVASSSVASSSESSSDLDVDASSPFLLPLPVPFVG